MVTAGRCGRVVDVDARMVIVTGMSAAWERTDMSSRLKIGAVELQVGHSYGEWSMRVEIDMETTGVTTAAIVYPDRAAAEAACEAWARDFVNAAAAAGIAAECTRRPAGDVPAHVRHERKIEAALETFSPSAEHWYGLTQAERDRQWNALRRLVDAVAADEAGIAAEGSGT